MSKPKAEKKIGFYQTAVIILGAALWVVCSLVICTQLNLQDRVVVFAFVPLVIVVGMFPNTFPALALKFTPRKITLSFADALVLLVASMYGFAPAVFVAGIEGFTGSRRAVRRLSSNLFSASMMSIAAAAAAAALRAVLFYGWGEELGARREHPSIAIALLVAGFVQITTNMGILSPLLARRQGSSILHNWKESFVWAVPMFLPVGTAASLVYFTLQYDLLVMIVIGGPILAALYLAQRQYRHSVQERMDVMEKTHRETIEALAVAINAKDEVTHEHVLRVQIYAAGVARILGCTDAEVEALKAGALLHDIGKIAVPDYILNKPGKLTAAEFEKMKLHTIAGAQILGRVQFPYPIVPVVRHHHERWDGRGYPDGLSGESIPVTARILSVVDCYDAVREDRQYRKGMTRQQAINLIMQGSGTQYDPRVVGTFIMHLPEFEAEIEQRRNTPAPTFGIEPIEELSDAARLVEPGAGLAEAAGDEASPLKPAHRHLKSLSALAQSVLLAEGRDQVLAAFTQSLPSVVPHDLCAVTLVSPLSGRIAVAHALGYKAELIDGLSISLGEGVTGWVIANGRPFYNSDPKLDLPPRIAEQMRDYRTLAVFPLMKAGKLYGAVSLFSLTATEYGEDHRVLVEEAVALLAAALARVASSDREGALLNGNVEMQPITSSLRLNEMSRETELAH